MNIFDAAKTIIAAEDFIKFLLPYAGIPPHDVDLVLKVVKEGLAVGENPQRIWSNVNKANAELVAGEEIL
jgi:hypothetical protein